MSLIENISIMLSNNMMKTIEETRRERLLLLKIEFKTYAELSRLTDISEAQFSQWANSSLDHKTGRPRVIHSDSARKIELGTKKPVGWMDQPIYAHSEKIGHVIDIMQTMDLGQAEELKRIAEVLSGRRTGESKE